MKIRSLVVVFFALACISQPLFAQRNKAAKADGAYKAGEYFVAIDLYKAAYNSISDKSNKAETLFKIAECYRLVNEPLKAELWYAKAISKEIDNPMATFYLAEMQKMNLKYEEAKDNFKKYKELAPKDTRADDGIRSCDLAQKWMDNPSGYQVESMKFFNSKQDEFSPAYANADNSIVLFTSFRDGSTGKAISGITGQNFGDIFTSQVDRKGSWSQPVPLSENINTAFDEGSPCLSKDFKTLYFTRCKFSKKEALGCQLCYSQLEGDEWGKDKVIQIAGDSIVIAHPAISTDELTLYFTSDMAGGIGGKDLWMVSRASKSDEWGKVPVNLGAQINTSADEMYPYIHNDGTLYFSSNGHIGLGGLDIYKAIPKADGTWKVENMESPINSNADDFGITFQNDQEKGFFSSSRTVKGDDDIYAFSLPPLKFNVIGTVRDEKTELPIAEATIKSISSDGITIDNKADKNGVFRFTLKPNTDYVFIGSKTGYLNGKERETTKGLDRSRDFKTSIRLASTAKPIELPNIFYDFAKWDLRPESMVALDKLIETLNENPTITIELGSHTDSRGGDVENINLSQKRAQSVVNYLIEKGIAADRLMPKGYGESTPKVVDNKMATQYTFLKEGDTLSEAYINSLSDTDLQEIAHGVNRRTDFRVLSTDYKAKN